jgi:hypothetical protein
MLKRTGFAAKWAPRPARQWTGALPTARTVVAVIASAFRDVTPMPKENAMQHEGYMAAVRKLSCRRCGWYREGWMQFAHADQGKGMGIKTDCRLGSALCGPHDDILGCHWFVGTSGRMSKGGRREFEDYAGASTRAEIIDRGWWPKSLPLWEGA